MSGSVVGTSLQSPPPLLLLLLLLCWGWVLLGLPNIRSDKGQFLAKAASSMSGKLRKSAFLSQGLSIILPGGGSGWAGRIMRSNASG